MLNKQLQEQIEQEGNDRAEGWVNKMKAQIAKTEYELGAEKYAALWQAAEAKAERYEKALKAIRDWQLPPTGQFYDNDKARPVSFSACYGSNGERDFMRNIANEALTPKTSTDE